MRRAVHRAGFVLSCGSAGSDCMQLLGVAAASLLLLLIGIIMLRRLISPVAGTFPSSSYDTLPRGALTGRPLSRADDVLVF